MVKKAAAYRVDAERKIITLDDSVTPTIAEEKDITRYVNAGYIIKHKSKERAKQAAGRADGLKDVTIKEALKDNAEALKEYEAIKKEGGFFKAKAWYKANYGGDKKKTTKKA